MRLTTENIRRKNIIKCRDYSNYDPRYCNNGGCYVDGETFYNNGDGTFTAVPYTSGEFCPKCGDWDCHGHCEEDEIISSVAVLFRLRYYFNDDNCNVIVE